MASAWGKSWAAAWGNSWGPIEVEEEQYSGGYGTPAKETKHEPLFIEWPEQVKTKEDIKADRERFGVILPEVAKAAIETVSKVIEQRKEVIEPQKELFDAEQAFKEELARLKIRWTNDLAQLIALEYERLEQERIDAEIVLMLFEM